MKESCNDSYKNAGVDVTAGYRSNELIKRLIEKTNVAGVLNHLNNFGGFFELNGELKNPVLVSSTDGVGTKIKLAQKLNVYDTVGLDCVAMCVNDIICSGAKPLFFLDYIACGKNYPEKIEQIVSGIAEGCLQSKMALIGGETAEHPNVMEEFDFDLAGFCVGIVEKNKILPLSNQDEGDVLIALPSSGIHSNGFSLIRKIFDLERTDFSSNFGVLDENLGKVLLKPTKIYVEPILNLIKQVQVKALCHITGGGFFENVPRMLQSDVDALIFKNKVRTPAIFDLIALQGGVSSQNMFSTFNMGVGMVCVVGKKEKNIAINLLKSFGVDSYELGELVKGHGKVEIVE